MIAGNSWFKGFLASCTKTATGYIENFVEGFAGSGWKLWKKNNRWKLEIDDLTVRRTMLIFELLISKIRALKGSIIISQGNGKIKSVESSGSNYILTLEDNDNSFTANDYIRCQTFTTGLLKSYWVQIKSVSSNTITVDHSEFGDYIPTTGDEIVQCGNATDATRQSLIYIHCDASSDPAIDILKGVNSKSFENKQVVSLGGENNALLSVNGLIKALTNDGDIIYQFSPDGSINIGKGAITYNPDTNKLTLSSNVVLTWDNLASDAQNNLKGDKGDPGTNGVDANLLDWVQEWNSNRTTINGESVISPKMFAGTNGANGLTGVALGRGVVKINGVTKHGVIGVKDGVLTFCLDAETGEAEFTGRVQTSLAGKRILIDPSTNSLTMLDANDIVKMSVSAEELSTQTATLYFTMQGTNGTRIGAVGSADESDVINTTLAIFVVEDRNAMLHIPSYLVSARAIGHTSAAGQSQIVVRTYLDSTPLAEIIAYNYDSQDTQYLSVPAYNTLIGQGSHTLSAHIEYVFNKEAAADQELEAEWSVGTAACSVEYTDELVEIAANGFRARFGSSNMLEAKKVEGAVELSMQCTNTSHATVGLRVTAAGVQINRGVGWINL